MFLSSRQGGLHLSEFFFWVQPEKTLCFYRTDGISSDYLDSLPIWFGALLTSAKTLLSNTKISVTEWVTREDVCQWGQPGVLGAHFRALLIPKSSKFHCLTEKCSSRDNGFFKTSFIQLVFLKFLLNTSSTILGVFEVSFNEIKLGN